MAGHFPDLFIRQVMHAAPLRNDVADEFMALLEPAFLVGLVRITVKHASPAFAVGSHLNGPGILEFRSVVCQYDPERLSENDRSEHLVQHVEDSLYRILRAGRKQEDQQKGRVPKEERHETLAGIPASFDGVHFHDFIFGKGLCIAQKILVGPAVAIRIADRVFAPAFLTQLVSDAAGKIHILDCEQPHVQIVVDRLPAAGELLPIYREDMAQGLSVPDEGRDEVIQFLQLLWGHIDPFSGLGKQCPVTLLSLFSTVKVLVGSAGFLCPAAITDIRR